jgi:DNA primase
MQTFTKKIKFLSSCFGENYKISRDGKNISFNCPNCCDNQEKFKFSINLDTFLCHCWVCSIKGRTPVNIIKKYISHNHAQKFVENFGFHNEETAELEEIQVAFPGDFQLLSNIDRIYDPDIRNCLTYLKKRGLNKKLLERHKIGIIRNNNYNRRVVFPSFDANLNLNFFVTRAIDDNVFIKYRNCKANKTEIIFDEYRINWNKELVLVEGVFDLVKCPENATCLLGSTLSENSILFRKIISNKTPIILALDSDMKRKTLDIAKKLSSYDVKVKILNLGRYDDVGEMTCEIVRQKCLEAPIYSREDRLQHLIGTISSGSIF